MSNAWPGSFRKSRHSLRTSGQLTTKLKFCTSDWASPSSGTATAIVLLPFSAPGCAGHAPSNNRKPFARVCTVSTREFSPFSLSFLTRIACIPGVELSPDWADAFHVAHFSCTKGTSAFSNAVDSLLTTCCVRLEPGECLPLRQLLKKSQCNALCSRPPLSREMSGSPECPTSIPLGICRLVLSRFPLLLLLC